MDDRYNTIVNTKPYLSVEYKLYAFDLISGKLFWHEEKEAGFISDISIIDGVLYSRSDLHNYKVGL